MTEDIARFIWITAALIMLFAWLLVVYPPAAFGVVVGVFVLGISI